MSKILITGGAGFIGTHLTNQLLQFGYTITILDNLSPQIHGENPHFPEKENVRFIKGDVRKKEDWAKAIDNQDVIIHLAAETGTGQSMYQIFNYTDVNVNGTAILLELLVNTKHNVKKVIVASSRAIYGEGKYKCYSHGFVYPVTRSESDLRAGVFEPLCPICNEPIELQPTDELSKIHPTSVYGITKQNQEQMVLNVCKAINIPAVAFRYQNVYGPGQSLKNPYTGILSIFSTQIRNNNNINIFEDGLETRDFVFINDVVDATISAIDNDNANYESFNVGSGVATTVIKVATKLKELFSSEVEVKVTGNYRIGDIRHNVADLSKIKSKLNFSPKVDFDNGISMFVNWVKSQEVNPDNYEKSISEMKKVGLLK